MPEKNKICFGKWEAAMLLVNMIMTKIFLNFPRVMSETGGTAAWLVALYVSALAGIGFFIIVKLYARFEGKDLLDIGEAVGGTPGRIICGVTALALLIFIVPVILREFSEDMKTIALTVSPISFVELFFLVGMVTGAYAGIESIVRFHAVSVPLIGCGLLLIMGGVGHYVDLSGIFPLLGTGAGQVFGQGFFKLSIYAELFLLFLIPPFIRTHSNFKTAGYTAIGISTLLLVLSSFVYTTVVPYPHNREYFLPIYQLARIIHFGRFFQRLESAFLFIWAASALLYLSSAFFFIVYIFKKTFKLAYYRPLIVPFALIIFSLSLIPENVMHTVTLDTEYFGNISWLIAFGFTISLLVVARIVKKKTER